MLSIARFRPDSMTRIRSALRQSSAVNCRARCISSTVRSSGRTASACGSAGSPTSAQCQPSSRYALAVRRAAEPSPSDCGRYCRPEHQYVVEHVVFPCVQRAGSHLCPRFARPESSACRCRTLVRGGGLSGFCRNPASPYFATDKPACRLRSCIVATSHLLVTGFRASGLARLQPYQSVAMINPAISAVRARISSVSSTLDIPAGAGVRYWSTQIEAPVGKLGADAVRSIDERIMRSKMSQYALVVPRCLPPRS